VVSTLATSKRGVPALKTDLDAIFQLALGISQAFRTQRATFTVSFPISNPKTGVNFDGAEMEDKSGNAGGSAKGRKVGILIFPGVFKTAAVARDCLVKTKVVCVDEVDRYVRKK
jgi:hypothetical protein